MLRVVKELSKGHVTLITLDKLVSLEISQSVEDPSNESNHVPGDSGRIA